MIIRGKLNNQKQYQFFDFSLDFDKISIVEISQGNFSYLTLDDYNKAHSENNYIGLGFFMVISLVLMYYGIKSNKEARNYKK